MAGDRDLEGTVGERLTLIEERQRVNSETLSEFRAHFDRALTKHEAVLGQVSDTLKESAATMRSLQKRVDEDHSVLVRLSNKDQNISIGLMTVRWIGSVVASILGVMWLLFTFFYQGKLPGG